MNVLGDLCIQPQRPLRIMARGVQEMGKNAQWAAAPLFCLLPKKTTGPKQCLGQNLHFQSLKPVALDCVFKQDILSPPFFFNWKEALNTLKVASGTSTQHAQHLLLLRQASLPPIASSVFNYKSLFEHGLSQRLFKQAFVIERKEKQKISNLPEARVGKAWSDYCETKMAARSTGTGASQGGRWDVSIGLNHPGMRAQKPIQCPFSCKS